MREREFHAWLARALPAGRRGLLPLGDDAAALHLPRGTAAVLTTDTLVEGTHFFADSPPRAIGRAATAVSLSDLAAKGATPAGILLGLVVPRSSGRRWSEDVLTGAETEAARFGAHVIGGDTKAGPLRSVGSTALGWARPDRLAPRSGARSGEIVVTTGAVGRGGIAYERLRSGRGSRRRVLAALLDVRPRVAEGIALAHFATAMLDTSDGLAESCRLIAAASGVRLEIDEARLPFARGLAAVADSPARRRTVAFYGGDYELLAALPPARFEAAARAVARVGGDLCRIGTVLPGRGAVLRTSRGTIPMPAAGWDPFAHRSTGVRRAPRPRLP